MLFKIILCLLFVINNIIYLFLWHKDYRIPLSSSNSLKIAYKTRIMFCQSKQSVKTYKSHYCCDRLVKEEINTRIKSRRKKGSKEIF